MENNKIIAGLSHQSSDANGSTGFMSNQETSKWGERFDKRFEDYLNGDSTPNPVEIKFFITDTLTTLAKELMEAAETTGEESQWQCPEHGLEFRIAPPLCEECNQCLEVNIPLAKLTSATKEAQRKVAREWGLTINQQKDDTKDIYNL